MTTRLMMAAVALTVRRTLERVVGFELICSAHVVEIRYKITPKTIANVTPICFTNIILIFVHLTNCQSHDSQKVNTIKTKILFCQTFVKW